MSWPVVKLHEICRPRQWKTIPASKLKSDGYPVYGANGKIGFYSEYTHQEPTLAITCRGATCGNVHISDPFSYINGNAMALDNLDSNLADIKYLYYLFLSRGFDDVISGSAQPQITGQGLTKVTVPLPPLDEQKRIAAILDKADAIRRKRQQAIQLADDFLKSVFLDMFGDPVTNPKGWKPAKMGDLIEFAKDGPHVSPKYSESGIPFLSTRHVKPSGVAWEDLKYVSQEEAKVHWKKCKPQKGDVLYTKGGTTGIACPVDFETDFAVWVHVALVRPKPELANHIWLTHMLNTKYCYQQSQRYTRGATNKDLGLKRMVDIEMYAPPLEEQERFVGIRDKVLGMLSKFESLNSHSLFNSLSQNAFTGDL